MWREEGEGGVNWEDNLRMSVGQDKSRSRVESERKTICILNGGVKGGEGGFN